MLLNAKLNKWISLDYNKLEESRLDTFACSSLPIKKAFNPHPQNSECNTSSKVLSKKGGRGGGPWASFC